MKFFAIFFMALLCGCASSSVQMLDSTEYPAKNPGCHLDVYTSESKVGRKYKEIAIITHKTAQDAFSDKGAGTIIPELSQEGCNIGADALIIRAVEQGTWGAPGHGEAIAIRYLR